MPATRLATSGDQQVRNVRRTRRLGSMALVAAALLLVGCGGDADDTSDDTATSEASGGGDSSEIAGLPEYLIPPGAEIKFSSVEDKYYNVTFKTPDGSPIGDGILKAAEDAGCAVENSTMDAGVKGYFANLSCDEGTGQAAGGAEGYEGEVTVNFTLK